MGAAGAGGGEPGLMGGWPSPTGRRDLRHDLTYPLLRFLPPMAQDWERFRAWRGRSCSDTVFVVWSLHIALGYSSGCGSGNCGLLDGVPFRGS